MFPVISDILIVSAYLPLPPYQCCYGLFREIRSNKQELYKRDGGGGG